MTSTENQNSRTEIGKKRVSDKSKVVVLGFVTLVVFAVVGIGVLNEMRKTSAVRPPVVAPASKYVVTEAEAKRIREEQQAVEARRAAFEQGMQESRVAYEKEKQDRLSELKRWHEVLRRAGTGQPDALRDNQYIREMLASKIPEVRQMGLDFEVMRKFCDNPETTHQQVCAIAIGRIQRTEKAIGDEVMRAK